MKFSKNLQDKIDILKNRQTPIKLGSVAFSSPLLLAPMASICNWPFRLLMEDLGAGGTVSELISCHGINYDNKKTHEMLRVDPREKNVGIQLFGEDPKAMALAAKIAEGHGPKFIDINMGCPVKKVVTKGGGSALLKNPQGLSEFLTTIKEAISIPLTIKIRTGWDQDQVNADEIIKVAHDSGVEFVAIHGRTRAQQYTGQANWNYIEELAANCPLPLIGNGDLHQAHQVKERLSKTLCQALMLARGPLRNPFIFLEAADVDNHFNFTASDYWEITQRLYQYICEGFQDERHRLVQIRKLIVWFTGGFPHATQFRGHAFTSQNLDEVMRLTEDYFLSLNQISKRINHDEAFMTSGHG
ncbi:MAG: tRNA dihydrouridine synthase DusB [Bacteriovoracaceae bacterium]|nr:tRNA dihydrouridine synthase DusB [Bacteriovoracaceae bacterium]